MSSNFTKLCVEDRFSVETNIRAQGHSQRYPHSVMKNEKGLSTRRGESFVSGLPFCFIPLVGLLCQVADTRHVTPILSLGTMGAHQLNYDRLGFDDLYNIL